MNDDDRIEQINAYIIKKRISRKEFAKIVGISLSTLEKCMSKSLNFSQKTIGKIEQILPNNNADSLQMPSFPGFIFGERSNNIYAQSKYYVGMYWMVFNIDMENAIVYRCNLFQKNSLYLYVAWRLSDLGVRKQSGYFFAHNNKLFLVGIRPGEIDIRSSYFQCNLGSDKGSILKGITSGVAPDNSVYAAKCALFRRNLEWLRPRDNKCRSGTYNRNTLKEWFNEDVDRFLFDSKSNYIEVAYRREFD
ncbi:MAG: helix-turn-helix domain-containing protein [Methylocystis sp.]